jgi:hypothetical protein
MICQHDGANRTLKGLIWQQFASNHGTTYMVVGKFTSAESAQAAADKIRAILQEYKEWWLANHAKWQAAIDAGHPTPKEEQLSRDYEVDWPHGLDFYAWQDAWQTDPVSRFRHYVFVVEPHFYLYYGPQPFDGLLRKFGGSVAVEVSESRSYPTTELYAHLTFSAPDEATADTLKTIWRDYLLAPHDAEVIAPWLGYHNGQRDPNAEEMAFVAQVYHSDALKINKLLLPIEYAEQHQDSESVIALTKQFGELYGQSQIHLTLEQARWISDALRDIEVDKTLCEDLREFIITNRTGQHIEIYNLQFAGGWHISGEYYLKPMQAITA